LFSPTLNATRPLICIHQARARQANLVNELIARKPLQGLKFQLVDAIVQIDCFLIKLLYVTAR